MEGDPSNSRDPFLESVLEKLPIDHNQRIFVEHAYYSLRSYILGVIDVRNSEAVPIYADTQDWLTAVQEDYDLGLLDLVTNPVPEPMRIKTKSKEEIMEELTEYLKESIRSLSFVGLGRTTATRLFRAAKKSIITLPPEGVMVNHQEFERMVQKVPTPFLFDLVDKKNDEKFTDNPAAIKRIAKAAIKKLKVA